MSKVKEIDVLRDNSVISLVKMKKMFCEKIEQDSRQVPKTHVKLRILFRRC